VSWKGAVKGRGGRRKVPRREQYIFLEIYMGDYCVVLTTFSKEETGEKIISSLLTKKLAACIQVQKISSYYWWNGHVANDPESLLFIKTKCNLYEEVEKDILTNHDYEVPEIIKLPIENGFLGYLNWMDGVCN
jgi:periplasmic divalent cation tolerance protein